MKKLVLQLIFGFIILPLSVAGTLFYLNKNGFFNISKVEVVLENPPGGQEQFLKPNVDNLESALAKYKGLSLWNIKLKKISREVSALNWVDGLNIKRSWPSTLSVRVRPHEVKLLFMAKSGKLVPIIKDGTFLTPIESKEAPDVALLEGETFLKKTELRKKSSGCDRTNSC
ncbi:cell division protein FtsQ/DivIB [Bdellovibrio bacteriovorus]|uniref:cell division protein FtsQ/DivIB n=1 Tax=Bdellovibrio bacteriovorus TaxID=959 RepID=UPI0035A8F1DD